MKKIFVLLSMMLFCSSAQAQITTEAYVTPDDVTITQLETNRVTLTNAINSADGSLLTDSSVTAGKLDDNANPEKRWDEAFSDFVFSGLLPAVNTGSLTTNTSSGIAYINGTRVVKDTTSKAYSVSLFTFVDLSNLGVYTYQEVTFDASEPGTTLNSIRLARVSTDANGVIDVRDDRTTQLTTIATASNIKNTSGNTGIQTEEAVGENILRFDTAGTEQIIIQDGGIIPTLDNDIDFGTSALEFKDAFFNGKITTDEFSTDTADIGGGTIVSLTTFAFVSQGSTTVETILDEDDFASNKTDALATQQSIKAYVDASNPAILFIQSDTVSGVQTIDIVQTIAADEVYMIVFEGTNTGGIYGDTFMRIGGDVSEGDYSWVLNGNNIATGDVLTSFNKGAVDSGTSTNRIHLVNDASSAGSDIPDNAEVFFKGFFTARNSDIQIDYELSFGIDTDQTIVKGRGVYTAAATGTINLLIRDNGGGGLTGRYYVYKLGSS